MKKKLISITLTLCMLLALLPSLAWAAEVTNTYGAFSVTYDDSSTAPTYSSNTLTFGAGTYAIANTAGVTTATTDKIVVSSGVTANITLNGVNIDVSSIRDACAFDLTGATVNLTLNSTNTLKSGNNKAGLQVPTGATLTINGIGSLSAFGGDSDGGAGIGGAGYYSAGTIIINSGVVTAKATSFGSGIGGGESAGGGTVTINGGMVTASGSRGGAGIGGGSGSSSRTCGSGGAVTICGGTVIANSSGLNSAGIGGGGKDYDYIPPITGTVTITGGSVKASSIPAQPKNSSAHNVYLATFTVPNDTSGGVDVSSMTFTSGGTAYTYSMTDTKSILNGSNGKVYVYLPGDSTGTAATAIYGGQTYTATVKDDNTATFQAPSFSLTKNTTTNGSCTVKVGGSEVTSAKSGDTVTITPVANSGYEVDAISVYKTGDTSTTLTVSSNAFTMPAYGVTVNVTFKASSYNVSMTTATNGSYTVKVGGSEVTSAKYGDTLTITPTASSNYEVDTISVYKTGDTNTTVAVSSNAFTMPAYDVTVNVTFKGSTYNVSKTTATNGSYTVKVGSSEVTSAKFGDTLTIIPTASSGYEVDTVSVYKTGESGTTVTVSSNAFTMPAYDVTVSVTFKASSYNVSKTTTTNGSYTVKVGGSVVTSARSGDTVTIAPTANSGYALGTVTVYKTGDTNTTVPVNSNTFTMPAYAVTVNVTFTAVSTPSGGGSSGGGGGDITPPSPAAPVIVDGKTENIGSSETTTNETKVMVDSNKLTEKINAADTSSSVQVPVSDSKTAATAEIVVKNVEDMAKKDMTLEVKSGNVSYQLPTTAIDTAAAMETLDASDASKVPLSVTITKLEESAVTVVNGELVVPPVEFTVAATYGGKTVEISSFSKYVQRSIEISKEQAAQITTAVVKNEDGTLRHVPTYVYEKDGKWFADINSRTNSTYALIHNETTFADTHGKWYNNIVSEMASRKIVSGKNSTAFDGDASITRAEFASIVVRALGLPADGKCSFTDVKSSDWYYGSVGTAVEYGLVSGCTDSSFAPNANITRQEAMAIVQRAAKIAEFTGTTGTLTSFTDSNEVSSWAKSAAEFNVGSGLIVGSNGELRPCDDISRAEAATVILHFLQKSGLVDVRSKI